MITTSDLRRFLIIQTAFIGDVILATALIEQLHDQFPEAAIDFLLRKGNEELLSGNPHVREVLIWDKKGAGGALAKYSGLLQLSKTIRQRQYDVVINLQRFGATGLLTALSGAPYKIGFDKNPFSRLYSHQVQHRIEPFIHEVDRNSELVRSLIDKPKLFKPKLYPSTADYQFIAQYQQDPYICIAPTSVWFTKQYPMEKWWNFVRLLPARYIIYLLGAPLDAELCRQIIVQTKRPDIENLAGKLTLLQSAALMKGAVMNYVNDSAPLHIASAMNAPTTAIFCSTVPEFGFGPLADVAHIVQKPEPLECRPCSLHGRRACPLGHFKCAYDINTKQLLETLPQ